MGDTYNVEAAGAVGRHAHADGTIIQKITINQADPIDPAVLVQQLESLRAAMRAEASTPEHDLALGEVTHAQIAASEGDSARVSSHLKRAGAWALATATAIGAQVAAVAIAAAIGA